MSTYPDDPPPRRRRPPPDYDDDDDLYRRPKPRDPYGEPRTNGRDRRRETYDASDEDDDPRRGSRDGESKAQKESHSPDVSHPPVGEDDDPRRGSRDSGSKVKKGSRSPDLPHPPIGEDRPSTGRQPEPETNGRSDNDRAYARRKSLGSHSEEKEPQENTDKPQRSRSLRHADPYDDVRSPRKSGRPRDGYDDFDPRRRPHKSRHDRYDDFDAPRRSRTDPHEDGLGRRKPSRRDADPRRRRPSYPADDTEPEYERPRRSHRSSRHDDDYGGYGTDRPRRPPRDDHDRGYRTDGREPKRDRHRSEGRRDRDDRHRGDYDDDRNHSRSHHSSSGRKKKSGGFGDFVEKGQKNWKKVEPVAKPLLAQLAQAYLHNAGH